MSVLHSQNSISLLSHEWWLEDIPEEDSAEPEPPVIQPEQLEWKGEMEPPEPLLSLEPEPPPFPDKFRETIEDLILKLNLNDEVKLRIALNLPYLLPRMGDRKTTCTALVLLLCRRTGVPWSLSDVAALTNIHPAKIFKRAQLLRSILD